MAERQAARRRTRAAIVAAATDLIARGERPGIDDIAAAADVSRRTVYMYFPTLDQLLLDATAGALSELDEAGTLTEGDAETRVDALVRSLTGTAGTTLPLGRKIIALTVDDPPADGTPRRGFRRTAWIESAVEPLRDTLSPEQYDRLVSALSVVAGWEALVVLRDVRGLAPGREEEVLRWMAATLVRAVQEEPGYRSGP